MRVISSIVWISMLAVTTTAHAQYEGRQEQQYQQLNRSIGQKQQNMQFRQQNQFENNQLQQNIQRNQFFQQAPVPSPQFQRR
ncbi:hypothetical protein WJT86_09715 [Microvirga sp. W0021]|uniref:DUF2756 domain-containing protein n=1 Tax=Hohaiivirga grylli TaxID=3133970 RepID=A0ABV0BK17_9HYPH